MNYWLICLPREDMLHCIEIGKFGRGNSQIIDNVKSGDKVACLVTKEKLWKVVALGEAISDYYLDNKNVFRREGIFDRFDLKVRRLSPEVPFGPIMGGMKFITKPEYWPVYFKKGIVKLTDEEWRFLEKACANSLNS